MRTIVIVQARMGSTRLPGKSLRDVAGKSVLGRVIDRVRRFRGIDDIVVATSTSPTDDELAAFCTRSGVAVFRGHPTDVLSRFTGAAAQMNAEACVRITADCPLIDPDVSSQIITRFATASPAVDYASNKIPQSFPRGLDTEVFTVEALLRADASAIQPYERSHVTIYLYEHPAEFRLLSVTSDVDRADWRWTVDTAEDLEFVRRIYEELGVDGNFGWTDVVRLIEREPELTRINSHVRQRSPHDEPLS